MASNVVPSGKPSVFDALTTSQKTALAYPSPLPGGIAGLIFDWVGNERLELRSEITDAWVEDNTAIHDQIALLPEKFTVDASTAEIVSMPGPTPSAPTQPLNPLPLVAGLIPSLTPGGAVALAARAVNGAVRGVIPAALNGVSSVLANRAASLIGQVAGRLPGLPTLPPTMGLVLGAVLDASSAQTVGAALGQAPNSALAAVPDEPAGLWGYYQGIGEKFEGNYQATVMGFIYQLWKGRVLFTVETPWGIFDSMAIELAEGLQPDDTAGRTDHKITFKKVRIANAVEVSSSSLLGRSFQQASEAAPSVNGNVGLASLSFQKASQILGGWILPKKLADFLPLG